MNLSYDDLVEDCDRCKNGRIFEKGGPGQFTHRPGQTLTVSSSCDCIAGKRPTEMGEAILRFVKEFSGYNPRR